MICFCLLDHFDALNEKSPAYMLIFVFVSKAQYSFSLELKKTVIERDSQGFGTATPVHRFWLSSHHLHHTPSRVGGPIAIPSFRHSPFRHVPVRDRSEWECESA